MVGELEFERPIVQLRNKIAELKEFTKTADVDLSSEIEKLESRLEKLEKDIYDNIKPWDRVQIARHPNRPTTLDYIENLFEGFFECHGDRSFGDDEAIVGGVAKFHGLPITVIGHQRGKDTKENIRRNFGMPHPEGYRKALRLMKQADKFNRPIVCFIDTKGAYPGKAAEERGQSEAIARNPFEMAGLKVPVICIASVKGKWRCACFRSRQPDVYARKFHLLRYITRRCCCNPLERLFTFQEGCRVDENYCA